MLENKVWLEVALNGAAGLSYQPNIPIEINAIVEQAIGCVEAGAAIVHLHSYKGDQPIEDAEIYAEIFQKIKQHCDPIIYPTIALSDSIEERIKPLRELAEIGLLEWLAVDPGSVNITAQMQIESGDLGFLYANNDQHIDALMSLAAEYGAKPSYAIYEPGFIRLGAAFAKKFPSLAQPIYRLMFSNGLLFGTTPSSYALNFYHQHLQEHAPGEQWMLSGLDAEVISIAPEGVELGAHLRVGLEDAPFFFDKSNIQLVTEAVTMINNSSRSLATTAEITLCLLWLRECFPSLAMHVSIQITRRHNRD